MRVRSYSKVNLGLAIGPLRPDGFHSLVTLYQTIGLHDLVTVTAKKAENTRILLTSNHSGVPLDEKNTAWRMVAGALQRLGIEAEVRIDIEKRLPVQGGMGAGSANAAAALIGLEKELRVSVPERMELAAEVGSDVPLFLLGGAVLGEGRGELVSEFQDLPAIWCVMAVPEVGVSTPAAFRDWDRLRMEDSAKPGLDSEVLETRQAGEDPANPRLKIETWGTQSSETSGTPTEGGLTRSGRFNRLEELSRAYASCSAGPSGIFNRVEGLAENHLLALVRTGIENDFEEVVFPQHPLLRDIKRELMDGDGAVYAALSGSGSAVFGLYESSAGAEAAQQRVQALGVKALVTQTMPREEYWREMFAE